MSGYNPQVAKERIKQLREVKKWTQSQMAKKLDQYIGYNGKGIYFTKIVLEGETGRQTINQLEGKGKRKITIPIAVAYADIFNVSIDYILLLPPHNVCR